MTTDLRAAIEALRTALEEAITWPSSGTLQHAQANWRIAAAEYDALDATPAPRLDVERARLRDELCACEPHFTGEAGHPPVVDYIVPEWLAQRIMAALAPSQPEPDL